LDQSLSRLISSYIPSSRFDGVLLCGSYHHRRQPVDISNNTFSLDSIILVNTAFVLRGACG